jgi:hypothetical protein
LTTDDADERMVLVALARRAAELQDIQMQNLATYIVNNYVKVRRRG